MLIALAAAVSPLFAQEPAALHPADAVLVVQIADAKALAAAYAETALAQMLTDTDVHEAIGRIMGPDTPPVDPIALGMDQYQMAVESGDAPPILELLSGIHGASMSLTVTGGDLFAFIEAGSNASDEDAYTAENLGVRVVVDFVDEPAAERMAGFVDQFIGGELPGALEMRTRAITAPGGGGAFGSDKLTVRSIHSTSPNASTSALSDSLQIVFGGTRMAVLAGNVDFDAAIGVLVAGGSKASAADHFAAGRAAFGAPAGAPMVELYLAPFVEQILATQLPQALPSLDLVEGLIGPLASMVIRGGHWRIRIDEGQFVTQGLHAAGAAGPMSGMIGAKELTPAALQLAHPDALVTSVTSLDADVLARTIEMLASEQGEGTLDQLEEAYGFRPERDIAASLGGAISYSLPTLKSLLAAPNLMGAAALDDREAFIRGMDGMFAMTEDLGGDVQVQRSEYRGAMVYTLSFTGLFGDMAMEGLPIDPANFFRPTITVMEDRVLVTTLPTHAKKEIRRVAKALKAGEEAGMHAGLSAMGVPEGATTVGYADWPTFFGNLYTQLKSLAPMLAGLAGGGADLPFELDQLPEASLLTRHFQPSERWVRRSEAGVQHYARSSIGPEVMIVPLGAVGVSVPMRVANAVPIEEARAWEGGEIGLVAVDQAEPALDAGELAVARTEEMLVEIAVSIRLYELDHKGVPPASLSDLLETSTSYPEGYLEGGAIPSDAWGRAFVYGRTAAGYALRSIGPNGIDDQGAGDDLTLD